jgi:hypothetical protein
MNYCKSAVKLSICTATAKERHAISRRVVTHAFLHWQPQSFEDSGSVHTTPHLYFAQNQREVLHLKRVLAYTR